MKKTILLVLLFLIAGYVEATGQPERGNRLKVLSKASISLGEESGFLSYNYTLTNVDTSEQTLATLDIKVDGVSKRKSTFRNLRGPTTKKWYFDVIDVHGLLSGSAASRILDLPPENGLAPGESMTLSFEAKGLPSIQSFWATGWTKPLSEDERDTLLALGFTEEEISPSDWRDNAYRGLTIGPSMPREPFAPLAFLDTLISYKHQALALGWLRDKKDDNSEDDEQAEDGIIKNLDKRLDKARKELLKGDSAKARKELEKLVKKVEKIYKKSEEAEKKKHKSEVTMTSEAYALLKFNAEYLIERLPEKSREKPRRDRD